MMLSSYLSPSRHGIFYFRWPIGTENDGKRSSIRISLRTRCPDRAGDLARHLASCGRLIRDNNALARLRKDQMREMVRNFFKASLDRYVEKLNDTGVSERAMDSLRQELGAHEDAIGGGGEVSDLYLEAGVLDSFRAYSDLCEADWAENEPGLRQELRKARRDQIKAFLSAAERLEHYSYVTPPGAASTPPAPALEASSRLSVAVEDFIAEHSRQWAKKTVGQNRAYLNILVEFFGPDRLLGTISKQDANEVKKVLQALPASRNTKPRLKAMRLMEAINEPGQKKISPKTINSHIQMFKMFFDWAERHGHSPHSPFEGMKVKKDKASVSERKPFTPDQVRLIYKELTENPSGLVRKDSHKWGMLLGLFTGARLNEICQLDIADVQRSGDTWFLNITDEGDDNKSVKSQAGRRKVPLHSELIQLGFPDFVKSRQQDKRLFPDYSYSANGGYGRNLGRWCNESFLPKFGIKQPGLVFHSLRHTIVTRLSQADVPEPIVQCIVGHARSGVTQEVYNREGYTLAQLSDAIERFEV